MSRAFRTRQRRCRGCASDASGKNDVTRTNDVNGTLSVITESSVIQLKTDVNESAASPRKANYRLERPLAVTASPRHCVTGLWSSRPPRASTSSGIPPASCRASCAACRRVNDDEVISSKLCYQVAPARAMLSPSGDSVASDRVTIFSKEATMFGMRNIGILLIGSALATLALPAAAQSGRGAATPVRADTATTVPTDRLVERYTDLAGSGENARSLVTGLRDGTDITLPGTTIANPAGKMGYGNVNITLALAEKQLSGISNPTPTQLNGALTNAENGILTLRAQGMGWGEIAHAFDLKLGDVMRASAAKDSPGTTRREERAAAQSLAKESRVNGGRAERPERAVRFERPEKPQRPERDR